MSRSYHNENSASVHSPDELPAPPSSESRAPRSPISRGRCSQNFRPILRHEYIIFDANTAAADVVIGPMPVDALPILSASFRIVEDGRNEIQARLDGCDIAGTKRQVLRDAALSSFWRPG